VRFPGLGENCTINSKKIKLRKKVLKKSDATIPDALQPDARNPPNFTTGFYTYYHYNAVMHINEAFEFK